MALAKEDCKLEIQYIRKFNQLPPKAIILYLYLRTYSNNKNQEAYPSWKTIIADLNIEMTYMYRIKKDLVSAGLIKIRTNTTEQNLSYSVHQMLEIPEEKEFTYFSDRNNRVENPFTILSRKQIITLAQKNLSHLALMIYLSSRCYLNGISFSNLRTILNNKKLRKCRICDALKESLENGIETYIRQADVESC